MFDDKLASVSVMPGSQLLVLLVLVPAIAFVVARRRRPERLYTLVGAALGAVMSPLALGLYSFYFLSPWGVIPGFLGLVLTLVHGVPGFKVATYAGLIPPGVVSELKSSLTIELINGLVWGLVYAFLGFAIDRIRSRRPNSR